MVKGWKKSEHPGGYIPSMVDDYWTGSTSPPWPVHPEDSPTGALSPSSLSAFGRCQTISLFGRCFQTNINQSIHVHAYIYVHIIYIYIHIYIYTFHFPINIYYHVFKPPISKHEIQRCPNISVWSAGGHPGHRCRFRRDAPLAGDTRRVAGHLLVRCGHASLSSGYRNGDIVGAYIYGLYLVAHRSD